jgi:lipopolysaccharide transport system ATP-binding protein
LIGELSMKYAIEFHEVWKKFKKGEKLNSLRDAIPHSLRKKDPDIKLEDTEFWALKDVSFNIEHGGVVGIMGPNGAGKSTILRLLSRIMNPNKGWLKVNGRLAALIEVTAGFHPELTGRENVYLNGTIMGMRKREIDSKFDQIVEFSGVKEFIDTPVKKYSSGMYSRLGFSVAAHMDPDILLVDEILSVGDAAFQAKCANKIRELLTSGATIVLISHQLNMIQSLCKRVILLQNGKMLIDGHIDDVLPLYQNIIYKSNENELKQKMTQINDQVRVDNSPLVDIVQVTFSDPAKVNKENFKVGEPVTINVEYQAREKIEEPLFTLEIIRSDGVLCCFSRTDECGLKVGSLQGKGQVTINMDKPTLAPGIYMIKLSIWDRDMIHPYVVHSKEVLRMEMSGNLRQSDAVFLPDIKWGLGS